MIREIARGGMGRVIEAVDLQLGRTVALKESLEDGPLARQRLAREVEITARLEHPSIVPIYDVGTFDTGEPFYVMRKISGERLDQVIARAPSLDDRLVLLPNLLAVADAVAHAHARGVIHRDLKPANVLVGELGESIVIDWGLARFADTAELPAPEDRPSRPGLTELGSVIGTPGYMAPEQVTAAATDARSDVYALGACLYHVLSGHPPLHGLPEAEMMARTATGRIERLATVVAGVPPDLVTIVELAMAREPARRYLDAGGVSAELRRFLSGQLVASHRYGVGPRFARWVRRYRALVIAVAAAVVALAVVGTLSVRRIVREQHRTHQALARERARSEELVVTKASALAERDPTLAIATLQQLAPDSGRWSEVGTIVSEARAHGVARGFDAPGGAIRSIAMSRDRAHPRLLVTGERRVLLHDLVTGTSAIVRDDLGADPVVAWCGALVVTWDRHTTTRPRLVDPDTGAHGELVWSRPIVQLVAGAGTIVFVDDEGTLAAVEVDRLPLSAKPLEIARQVEVHALELSPTGTWLLVTAGAHRTSFRRVAGTWHWQAETPASESPALFDPAEQHFAVASPAGDEVSEYALADGALARHWRTPAVTRWLAYVETGLVAFSLAPPGIVRLHHDGHIERVEGAQPPGWVFTRQQPVAVVDGALAWLSDARSIELMRGTWRQTVRAPEPLLHLAAAQDRYLVGASTTRIVVWDLDRVLPRSIRVDAIAAVTLTDHDTVIGVGAEATAELAIVREHLDGTPRETLAIPPTPWGAYPVVLADATVVVRSALLDAAVVIAPALAVTVPAVAQVASLDASTVILGTRTGAIVSVDRATGAATSIAELAVGVQGLVARGNWLVARTEDGALWRRDPAGRQVRWAGVAGSISAGLSLDDAGNVYLADGGTLVVWTPAGATRRVATLEQPLDGVHVVAGGRVLISTRAPGARSFLALHLYDPGTGALDPLMSTTIFAVAADGRRAVAVDDQALVVLALDRGGVRYRLADAVSVDVRGCCGLTSPSRGLAISPDGDVVVVVEAPAVPTATTRTLHRWNIAPVPDAMGWVGAATNAVPPRRAHEPPGWRSTATAR